ncbi:MAG: HAMP domain-containing histidine kinase [Candidatus Eisenbacteria bacterium]|nr:HAMP domain-containing histidine kinase [Candidatus Eisenbacteria bacterium]
MHILRSWAAAFCAAVGPFVRVPRGDGPTAVAPAPDPLLERLLDLELEVETASLRVVTARAGASGTPLAPTPPGGSLVGASLPEFWAEEDRERQAQALSRLVSALAYARISGSASVPGVEMNFVGVAGDTRVAEVIVAAGRGPGMLRLGIRDVTETRLHAREIEERAAAMEFTNQYITELNQELERSGRELEEARGRLTELNESKSRFLAMAAHELRTPMTAAKTAVSMLQAGMLGPVAEQQAEVLGIIHQNVDRLVRLVNDLLDLARIEAGKVELRRADFDPAAALRQCADLLAAEAASRDIAIRVEAAGAPAAWSADPDRFQQVVLNLLGNALKFTPEGGHVALSVEETPEGLHVAVRDSGAGISAEELPHLFRPFERLDNEATRKARGTGLGLSISRELVELHGGRIWPESAPGEGTTIRFLLPATRARHAA